MRQITTHHINPCNEALDVVALGEPGAGGAYLHYEIRHPHTDASRSFIVGLNFQSGDPANGVNGITNEALLAVLIDRMEGFQRGPFACANNAMALDSLRDAMAALKYRSQDRTARGVEGQHRP